MADIEEVEDMPSVVHHLPCLFIGFGGKQGSWGENGGPRCDERNGGNAVGFV